MSNDQSINVTSEPGGSEVYGAKRPIDPNDRKPLEDLERKGLRMVVGNVWVELMDPHPYHLDVIDHVTRYPTEVAQAILQGFRPPAAAACPDCREGHDPQGFECPRCHGTGATHGWDGWVRLLRRTTKKPPYFPTGLLPRVRAALAAHGVPAWVDDQRVRPEPGCWGRLAPVQLRDYQREAVDLAVRDGRGVLDLPPRGGKTRIAVELVRRLALPTVWMAPTDRIVHQTHEVVERLLGPGLAYRQTGVQNLAVAASAHIVLCTAATGAMLPPSFWRSRQVWIVDEFHRAAAKSYQDMAKRAQHIYHRYGMTGTFFRSGDDEMAMHAILSDVIYRVGSDELLARGHLVPTHVVWVPVESRPIRVPRGTTYQQGVGKLGIQEHPYRQQLAANCAAYLDGLGRRTLCLVATKRQGRDLCERIAQLVKKAPAGAQFKAVEFVSTDTDRPVLNKILDSFIAHQEVRVLIGTSLLGEGVDLPGADALVYARGEKAEVSLVQNAYRVCTAAPGKPAAIIVDFADRHHPTLLRHAQQRLACYHQEPIFTIDVLESAEQFTFWAQSRGLGDSLDSGA